MLTAAQRKALPIVAACPNISEAAREAGIGRATLHRWLRRSDFTTELTRHRQILADTALEAIRTHIGAAIATLRALLDCESLAVRRGAARDLLDMSFRLIELNDVTTRLDKVEKRLNMKGWSYGP